MHPINEFWGETLWCDMRHPVIADGDVEGKLAIDAWNAALENAICRFQVMGDSMFSKQVVESILQELQYNE